MHTELLNLGFIKKPDGTYVCEDLSVIMDGGKLYVLPERMEVTIDGLESILLED